MMHHRERFEAVMRHKPVDRIPFDLAGTSLTDAYYPETADKLRKYLGIAGPYEGRYSKFDERILEKLGIDFRRVGDILSPAIPAPKEDAPGEHTDCWGVTRVFTGMYWDIKNPPLRGKSLRDLEDYPWPEAKNIDMEQIETFREEARRLYHETDTVICGEHPVFGVFELGCWMCGFDDFMLRMALEPEFVFAFFDRILAYQKEVIALYYGAIGEYIHLTTSGDDFGTQTGPFVSPDMFAEMIQPYYKERIAYTKKFTKGYFFHHTCGSVYDLIPHLIDAGVDILNPIQPGAKDMEPEKLSKAYGDKIAFWGGIDTQHVLPGGSAEDVKKEVYRVLDAMTPNAGYILAPAHNLQPDVPAENIAAVYEAAREYFGG